MAGDDADLRAQLDADHARRLLAMLVSTSGRLAPVIDDWRAPLVLIADEIVPTHADLFAVDVIDVDTGRPEQVLWRGGDRSAAPTRWTDVIQAGISAGAAWLHPDVTPARTGGAAPRTVLAAVADELGLSSLALVPVTTRGLTLGTLAVGTSEPRRGLRPSDVEAYQELATRLAMAIERVALHQEAQASTRRAVLNAQRLGRAAEAAPAIAASLDLVAITEAAVAEAARVLEVPVALCSFGRPSGATVVACWPANTGEDVRTRLEEAGNDAVTRGRLSIAGALAVPLMTATGTVCGYLAVYDPNERTFTAEEDFVLALLGQATAAAANRLSLEGEVQQSRRMESLGRLAGGVAHDFNNLLTIITGYSDILERGLGDDHPQIEAVQAIQAAAARASTFTSQLLTISRRRIGREGAVDVNAVLRDLMDVLPRLLTEDVELTVVRADGELWVDVEAGQLEQVLLNLVVNARNAMPDGGALTVTTELVEQTSMVLIVVRDSGVGMDPATAERCFEPFFSGPEGAKGTGLGLATVYGIVEQAGGRITFDTAVGEGTTFSITLPGAAAPEAVPDDESADIRDEVPTAGRTVLLVEDDPLIRALADRVLSEAGYSVHSASSAEDAFDVADLLDDCVDLLLTDVVMPGAGGADLAAELSGRVDGLRVVFMSGFIDDLRRQRLVRTHPASVFLPKPFGPQDLLTAVAAAMSLDQGSKR